MQEFGGLDPVMASGATAERAKIMVGAEIGRYWIFDQKIFDLSAYGKFIDNVAQNFSDVTSASGRKASRCRASAKAGMAPTPVPRRR